MFDPFFLSSCALTLLGLLGISTAILTRLTRHGFWQAIYFFCLVALAVAAGLSPAWDGGRFVACSGVIAAMILTAVWDLRPGVLPEATAAC